MNAKDAWNSVYKKYMTSIAWGDEAWINWCVKLLCKYITTTGKILDYGCGTGTIAHHFMDKGYQVELAELSDVLIQKLKSTYDVPVYAVSSPNEIKKTNYYDYIISMGVFQHISPDKWNDFLGNFHSMLKKKGTLIITGWDDKDEILNSEGISRFTKNKIYGITSLEKLAKENSYQIIATGTEKLKMKMYPDGRLFRYFILQKDSD